MSLFPFSSVCSCFIWSEALLLDVCAVRILRLDRFCHHEMPLFIPGNTLAWKATSSDTNRTTPTSWVLLLAWSTFLHRFIHIKPVGTICLCLYIESVSCNTDRGGSVGWASSCKLQGHRSIPSQGTCLGGGPGPQLGVCKGQLNRCFFCRFDVSLPPFLLPFPSKNK